MNSKLNAVIAKSKAIYGNRIKPSEYDTLMHKNTVSQLTASLKETPRYKKDLNSLNELQAHRGQIEYMINKSVFDIYIRLCSFIPINTNGFNSFWIKKLELDVIINTIMFIKAEQWDKIITSIPAYLNPYLSYDLLEFGNIRSMDDFIKAVSGSVYHKLLKNILPNSYGESTDFEEISTQLYTGYYKWLFKCIDKEFTGSIENELKEAVFRQINTENLLLSYRMKIYFKRTYDEIERLLVPFRKGFSGEQAHEILSDINAEERILLFLSKKYLKNLEYDKDFLEIAIQQDSYRYFKSRLKTSEHGSVVMYSLIKLLDIERHNITTIIEGVRYSMPPSEIRKLIVI